MRKLKNTGKNIDSFAMEDWKKELKSRFDDFQMREPEGLWDSIEKELPDKKRKVIPFGWITLAAVT
ncbi:MAG: hypothetical protein II761_01860, partial [Bacteroidales bacterium]|nr:hypothetical protein [Bacteroidales bacterium]